VHKRRHEALLARKVPAPTVTEIAESEARLKVAEQDGAYIDVKRELTARETRQAFAQMVKDRTMHQGQEIDLDAEHVGFAMIRQYVVGWNFVDDAGTPVPFTLDAIDNLDQQTFQEIDDAINAHVKAVDAEKNRIGETLPATISPSAA
jgi:hypothetical protein